jgi:crotonobetainyl-CoA:carnitine CoA-transferase CaiB-like acyl-CoA transferase
LVEIPDDEMGTLPMHGIVPRTSGFPQRISGRAPVLREHNRVILAKLGIGTVALAELAERGVIGGADA